MSDAERIAELEEENAWLRSELGLVVDGDQLATLRKTYEMATGAACLVLALYRAKGRLLNKLQLHEAIPAIWKDHDERCVKIVDVRICHARKGVGRDAIETICGQGYGLTPEGMEKVRAALGEQPASVAA